MIKNQKYISLTEATKYCNYSQEYLSLRARQGKLRSIKLGRNWVTTKEWLRDYIQKMEEINDKNHKAVLPPENLPVGSFTNFEFQKIKTQPSLIFIMATIFILLITSVTLNKEGITKTFDDTTPYVEKISQAVDRNFKEEFKFILQTHKEFYQLTGNIIVYIGETGNYFVEDSTRDFYQTISEIKDLTFGTYKNIFHNISNGISQASLLAITPQEPKNSDGVLKETINTFKDYSNWLTYQTSKKTNGVFERVYTTSQIISNNFIYTSGTTGEKIVNNSFKAGILLNKEINQNAGNLISAIKKIFQNNYYIASNFIKERIAKGVELLTQLFGQPEIKNK